GRGSCGPYGSPRVISLSNQPLVECVAENVFDRNLYTTLAGQVVDLPPLSKRLEDIAELVQEFFRTTIAREGHGACQLTDQALEMLYTHNWPGNLRELWNVLSHAACLTEEPRVASGGIASWIVGRSDPSSEWTITLRQMERMLIESTFAQCGGNREDTARSLGIGLRTLSGKLRDYGYPPRGGPGSNQLSPSLKVA
ncbi:MAG: helix-turn-helix domain-containing protein, partial [Planctomycetaceae bacterium]